MVTQTVRSRSDLIVDLSKMTTPSVLVIGGGINGISVYRELALQGIDVLLVERGDWCEAASGALSRMIHGGLRYMETGEFKLVKESLAERNRLLRNAPHYVSPLATTVPIFDYVSGITSAAQRFLGLTERKARRGGVIIKIGLTMYDAFSSGTSGASPLPKHSFSGRKATFDRWPSFNQDVACSATYYDGQISHPERLGLEMILDVEAACPKSLALNYMSVTGSRGDRILLKDALTGSQFEVSPKTVVNATGAWIDFANGQLTRQTPAKMIGGTKGSHLIVENKRLFNELGDQMIYYENQEGRVCILFRFFDKVLIGSTDIPIADPNDVRCEDDEIDYIIQSVGFVFPDITVDRSQIIYTFAGVRPLPVSDAGVAGRISRNHSSKIIAPTGDCPYPVHCMIGGKWTTFRAFGEEVADEVLAELGVERTVSTRDLAIGGGRNFPTGEHRTPWVQQLAARSHLPAERIEILLRRYGSKADQIADFLQRHGDHMIDGLPSYSRQEIMCLIRYEHVETIEDIIVRRSSIAITGWVTASIARIMADILGEERSWSEQRRAQEVNSFFSRFERLHGRGSSASPYLKSATA